MHIIFVYWRYRDPYLHLLFLLRLRPLPNTSAFPRLPFATGIFVSYIARLASFRPNVVVAGCNGPWQEDQWLKLRVGTVPMQVFI